MGEHADSNDKGKDAPQETPSAPASTTTYGTHAAEQERAAEPAPKRSVDWRAVRENGVGLLAAIVRWVGLIFALILVLHVIFAIGEANPDNGIVSTVSDWSEGLSMGFKDLFTPDDEKLAVLVNYGIAAIFWLVVSAVLAKIVRRVGGAS